MSGSTAATRSRRIQALLTVRDPSTWTSAYRRRAVVADFSCALAAGLLAYEVRFDAQAYQSGVYLAFTVLLPVLWTASVALAGGYDPRFIGVGSDEFRKILNAAVSLTAVVAIASYVVKFEFARGYVVIALPCAAVLDLVARHVLRRRLHRLRSQGACLRRVVAVGHAPAVADLVLELRRSTYHGLSVVGACLAGSTTRDEIAGVPVFGGLGNVTSAVGQFRADTVAVPACQPQGAARRPAGPAGAGRGPHLVDQGRRGRGHRCPVQLRDAARRPAGSARAGRSPDLVAHGRRSRGHQRPVQPRVLLADWLDPREGA